MSYNLINTISIITWFYSSIVVYRIKTQKIEKINYFDTLILNSVFIVYIQISKNKLSLGI